MANQMIVAVLLNRLFEWSQNFITRELVELKHQGVELYVGARKIVDRDDLGEEELALQNQFIAIPENPFKPASLLQHFKFLLKHTCTYFKTWIQFFTFGHKSLSKMARSFVCLFRAAAVAEVILTKNIQLLHAHFMTAPTETALYLSAFTGVPFGCTAHAMDIYQDNSGMQKKLNRVSYVITETLANAAYFKANWKIEKNKVSQIYNSIPLQSNLCLENKPHTPFTFLAVGRLVPKKGFEYLLEACRLLKSRNVRFLCRIVGKGPLEEKILTLVQELALTEVVQFQGYIAPNRIASIYDHGDVLVMPSIIESNGDRDGLPTVCIEACTYGLPLICTDVSGLPECIVEGQNGLVVPQKNPAALEKAMFEIMTAKDYDTMCKKSLAVGAEKFNGKVNVGKIKDIMLRHL